MIFWSVQTKAAKPVLGKYYRQPEKSALLPFHLLRTVARSLSIDHFVSDDGDIVYYQNDLRINNKTEEKQAWTIEQGDGKNSREH